MLIEKLVSTALFSVMIVFTGLCIATSANADCPDKVSCEYRVATFTSAAGQFNVPTCYKFGDGCKPWHCDGRYKDTNRDYWTAQCRKEFPTTCTESNDCRAHFPGALIE